MRKPDRINYKANASLYKPLIALKGIMVLWAVPAPCPFPFPFPCPFPYPSAPVPFTSPLKHLIAIRPGVLCPIRPPAAYRTPQALQAPRGSIEFLAFHRYRTALAADVADNGETGGKRHAGSEPCPLHQVLCFVDLTKVGKRFKADLGLRGRDDLHA